MSARARIAAAATAAAALVAVLGSAWAPPAGAAPYHDTSQPSAHPRGWVIVIHAGGWRLVGRGMTGLEQPEVDLLNSWGYATVNVDYRRGARGLTDVLGFYDRLRKRLGPKTPICLDGSSAGGHLALMAALRRPRITCVITRAAPTRLEDLHGDLLRDAHHFFDPHGGLTKWSPAHYRLATPALIAHGTDDPYVGFGQAKAMRRHARRGRLVALRPGKEPWVHTSVARASLERFVRIERSFLKRATG
jgi:acetyl esterase/lipase